MSIRHYMGSGTLGVALLVLLLLSPPLTARGALIERDLQVPGDGLITLDSDTNLEWLDPSVTLGLSFDEVSGGAGGWLADGWRYATGAELCALFSSNVLGLSPCRSDVVQSGDAEAELAAFIGVFSSEPAVYAPPFVAIMGYLQDSGASEPALVGRGFAGDRNLAFYMFGMNQEMLFVSEDNWSSAASDPGTGSYLVRPVPEPGSGGLVAAGLAVLGVSARRRNPGA